MKSGSGGVPDPPRAGRSFDEELVGPSSGAWGRAQGEYCRVAFFTTDGGIPRFPLTEYFDQRRSCAWSLKRGRKPTGRTRIV